MLLLLRVVLLCTWVLKAPVLFVLCLAFCALLLTTQPLLICGVSCNSRIVSTSHFIEHHGREPEYCLGACNRNHHYCMQDGLSGNSRTVMIATVAASADQYHHSINTLKYANRAKDIKTHIVQNVGSVESHISDYRRIIDNLQVSTPSTALVSCLWCNRCYRCDQCPSTRNPVSSSRWA